MRYYDAERSRHRTMQTIVLGLAPNSMEPSGSGGEGSTKLEIGDDTEHFEPLEKGWSARRERGHRHRAEK